MSDPLRSTVRGILDLDAQPQLGAFTDRLERLKSLASAIEAAMRPAGSRAGAKRPRVTVAPGWTVNIGQQFNVVVTVPRSSGNDFEQNLFRVYIPSGNQAMQLDFFGEELQPVSDLEELDQAVFNFLAQDEVKASLRTLREMVGT